MRKISSALLAVAALSLVACQKNVHFTGVEVPVDPQTVVPDPVCHIDMIEKPKPTNILLMVDQSGSNSTGNGNGVGTDPKKTFRFGILNKFIAEHGSKSHLRWNLVTFADKTAKSLVKGDNAFTSTLAFILQALTTFVNTKDEGYTPYRAALALAKNLVAKSELQATEPQTTLVAFLTDGYPTDYCSKPKETSCPGNILEQEIDRDVLAIAEASKGEVQFSTLYYGPPDPESTRRLERMAKVGQGQFVDLNESSKVDLNDVIHVPQKVCN